MASPQPPSPHFAASIRNAGMQYYCQLNCTAKLMSKLAGKCLSVIVKGFTCCNTAVCNCERFLLLQCSCLVYVIIKMHLCCWSQFWLFHLICSCVSGGMYNVYSIYDICIVFSANRANGNEIYILVYKLLDDVFWYFSLFGEDYRWASVQGPVRGLEGLRGPSAVQQKNRGPPHFVDKPC